MELSAQGTLPTAGGDMNAEPITDTLNHIMSQVNGNNLDEANVDYAGADGIMVINRTQTVTSQKTMDATFVLTGTYLKPLVLGTIRIWHDATNGFIRAKVGSTPSTETDGNILMWGA